MPLPPTPPALLPLPLRNKQTTPHLVPLSRQDVTLQREGEGQVSMKNGLMAFVRYGWEDAGQPHVLGPRLHVTKPIYKLEVGRNRVCGGSGGGASLGSFWLDFKRQ